MSDSNTNGSLKILMLACLPFFSSRGTPISVRSRLEDLSKLGHEVDLVTYHVGEDIGLPGLKTFRTVNIPFIKQVPVGPSLKKIFLDVFIFFKAFRLLLSKEYDLIHTHEEASYFGALFSRIFKVRHLYDFHSSLPQAMKNFGYERHRSLIYAFELLEKYVVNSCKGVITISEDLDTYVMGLNNKIPRVTIENFQHYDFESADEETSDSFKLFHTELNGSKVVLYSGTFERYQGLELLLAAAQIVIKSRNDTVFVLAGGNKNQIKGLKELASKLGIASSVNFTGNLPIDEIPQYMKIADVLLSTRTIGNNPPLKIYDYLGAGKPIVATNIVAHTQVLNEDTAVLVNTCPEAVAQGIIDVIEDSSYASKLALNSRKCFEKNYSSEDKMEKTRQILNAIMQRGL